MNDQVNGEANSETVDTPLAQTEPNSVVEQVEETYTDPDAEGYSLDFISKKSND